MDGSFFALLPQLRFPESDSNFFFALPLPPLFRFLLFHGLNFLANLNRVEREKEWTGEGGLESPQKSFASLAMYKEERGGTPIRSRE